MFDKQQHEYFQDMLEAQQNWCSKDIFDRQPVKKNCDGRSGALKTCITVNVFYSLYKMFFKMYIHQTFILILQTDSHVIKHQPYLVMR